MGPYLGFVNLQGVAFTETLLATGMGVDLCLPVMRSAMEKKGGLLNYEEARATLLQCIRLAYLRDCRSWPKFHLAKVDATGRASRVLCSSTLTGLMRRALLGTSKGRRRLEFGEISSKMCRISQMGQY